MLFVGKEVEEEPGPGDGKPGTHEDEERGECLHHFELWVKAFEVEASISKDEVEVKRVVDEEWNRRS